MRKTFMLCLMVAGISSARAQETPAGAQTTSEPEKSVAPTTDHAKEIQMRRDEKRKKMETARKNVRNKIKSDTLTKK